MLLITLVNFLLFGSNFILEVDVELRILYLGETNGNKCITCPRSRSTRNAAKPDGTYDVIIIGAGCIGGAIARELSKTNASILLLEAADDVTQGATKGNSGIVHAGFDDTPGALKASLLWF